MHERSYVCERLSDVRTTRIDDYEQPMEQALSGNTTERPRAGASVIRGFMGLQAVDNLDRFLLLVINNV